MLVFFVLYQGLIEIWQIFHYNTASSGDASSNNKERSNFDEKEIRTADKNDKSIIVMEEISDNEEDENKEKQYEN